MELNSSPASDTPVDAPAPAEPTNPNDLTTEMSEAEEQAFVDKTLGIKPEANQDAADPTPAEPTPKPAKEEEEPQTPQEPETPEPEPPVVPEPEPEAPTEIAAPTTDDLWVEVQDSEGNAVKLSYDPENPNTFLPADFTFKDDQQLFEILDAKNEMANLYRERTAEYQTQVEESEAKENAAKSDAEQTASWDAEIQDLIDGGFMETPKAKQGDKNFLEDPTVQKIDAVFKYMAEQNKTRLAEGKPVLRSFGTAYNLYNKTQEADAAVIQQKKDNDLAKARGSLVGGTSTTSTGEAPLYTVGSAKSIWEAARDI